jgi:hypothetical protein
MSGQKNSSGHKAVTSDSNTYVHYNNLTKNHYIVAYLCHARIGEPQKSVNTAIMQQ